VADAVGRFAPTPSGPLHLGSLASALASFLDARAHDGRWLVRIEDLDAPRMLAGADADILKTLEAHGLTWDGEVLRQSARLAHYEHALARLTAAGHCYPCACSRREIADSALQPADESSDGPVYPGTCRAGLAPGRTPRATRVRTDAEPYAFDDAAQGVVEQALEPAVGDFVIKRADGPFAYQLAVVVDDAEQAITDVVRGADLLQSTPRQILLQRLLGWPTPRYLHFPVATNARGEKLSKQTLAPALGVGEAGRLLAAALDFLGQPRPAGLAPREILAVAVKLWEPARIPRLPARAVAGNGAAGIPGSV